MTDLVLATITLLGHALLGHPLLGNAPALISWQVRGGFAVSVLCAFLAVGLLAIVAKFATTKPRNRRRPPDSREGRSG